MMATDVMLDSLPNMMRMMPDGTFANIFALRWAHNPIVENHVQLSDWTTVALTDVPQGTSHVNEIAPGIGVVYDTKNQPLGAFLREDIDDKALPIESVYDAVTRSGVFYVTNPTPEQLDAYCAGVETLFSNLRERGKFPFGPPSYQLN